MAQFDVYANPSKRTKAMLPLLVDIQNDLISDIATRMVIPLGRLTYFQQENMKVLTPLVEYEEEQLVILTPQISAMPKNQLKEPIGTLEHLRQEIIAAMGMAISGI